MIKEEKNIDFYTTGRQPSKEDFARINEWIKKDKQKQQESKNKEAKGKRVDTSLNEAKHKATV